MAYVYTTHYDNEDGFYTLYPVAQCERMIRHYEREAVNMDRPVTWRTLARTSIIEWRIKLERAQRSQEAAR